MIGDDTIVIMRAIFFSIFGSISLFPVVIFMVGSFGIPTMQNILQNIDEARLIPFSFGFKKTPTVTLINNSISTKNAIHSLIKVTRMLKLKIRKIRLGMMNAKTVKQSQT